MTKHLALVSESNSFSNELILVFSQEKIVEVTDEEAERILNEEKLKKADKPAEAEKKAEEANGGAGDDDDDTEEDKGICSFIPPLELSVVLVI